MIFAALTAKKVTACLMESTLVKSESAPVELCHSLVQVQLPEAYRTSMTRNSIWSRPLQGRTNKYGEIVSDVFNVLRSGYRLPS